MKSKNLYVIAGPNGSGKSTFAKEFLPIYVHCPRFINTDIVAQGLSFAPEKAAMKAGRIVLQQIEAYASQAKDFGFETTLSGRAYARTFSRLGTRVIRYSCFFYGCPMFTSLWPV